MTVVVNFAPPAPEPGTMLDYALRYAALGWFVFPVWGAKDGKCKCHRLCKSPAKHPVEHVVTRGQDDATLDPAIIRRWWSQMPDAGIAAFLKPSGLCAIDIDPRNGGFETIDYIESQHGPLVSDVLAFTQGGGEHRIFKLTGDLNLPGKLGHGIDVKRNGYVVLAPTQGTQGVYDWEASSDPLEGSIPSPLPDWVRDLASPSTAQEVSAASERFITPEQIGELRSALNFFPSDDRDMWVRTGMALHSLGQEGYTLWREWSERSDKFDPVDLRRVWQSFKPGKLNFESVFHTAQAHGWINPLSGFAPRKEPETVVEVDELIQPSAPAPAQKQPAFCDSSLLTIPVPVLQEVAEWMEEFSEEPNRQISIQGALALASVLSGRLYESSNGNVGSMYFLTLAGTGTGKGYPKESMRKLLSETGLAHLMAGSGNTSAGSVFSALFKSPTHIQISDEFGKHLQMARRNMNPAMADAFAVMTEAYSDATGMLVPRNYSNFHLSKKELSQLDSKIVQRPAITLFAFATPEQVFDNLTTAEIDDGFLNRLIVAEITSEQLPERKMGNRAVPAEFIAWARSVRRLDLPLSETTSLAGMDCDYDMAPSPLLVPISDEAMACFAKFKSEIKQTEYPEKKLTMRWRENAMRLSTSLAVASNPESPVVCAELATWSINYIRHHGLAFIYSAVTKIADNDFHRLYLAVLAKLDVSDARGLTEGDIADTSRVFKRSPTSLRNQVFEAISREGRATQTVFKTISGRGKKRVAWVHSRFEQEETIKSDKSDSVGQGRPTL